MLTFKSRKTKPVGACIAPDCEYWDVYEKSKKIGWFGVFINEGKQYTDVEVLFRYRGKGYFKAIYDHYIENLWNKENVYAFVGHDNRASIKAHDKYGCKKLKKNLSTWLYMVKRKRRTK